MDDGHMKRRPGEMAATKQAGVWMYGMEKDMVVLSEGGGKMWRGRRRGEEGVGGSEERFPKCSLGREDGRGWLVRCWLPPRGGSLERVAPSMGRLPREAVQLDFQRGRLNHLETLLGFRERSFNLF